MAETFLNDDFLLQSETARSLYHEHAAEMPIYDYHCHLSAEKIAADQKFVNLSQAWLYGDHYKWRAMRANGIDERFIIGQATDFEKFQAWAETVPQTLRNPLYHWTHLELKNYFGISEKLLCGETAKVIYDSCSVMLNSAEFSVRNLLRKMNLKLICTTENPVDLLEHHKKIRDDGFEIKVHAAFRGDCAFAVEDLQGLNAWIDKLERVCDNDISSYDSYICALRNRHQYFHENLCRLSDYGLERAYAEDYTESEIKAIFGKIRTGKELSEGEKLKFKSAMLYELAVMDYEAGWAVQLHLGALRNTNSRKFASLGPDRGYDSIGDFPQGQSLAKFLDRLEKNNKLGKMIIYNLNPAENEVFATLAGDFQGGETAGKMQYGAAWWFNDQKDGIEKHLNCLSNMGLLSRFVGMLTDSRSFLSFPRHEYFRRILCNMLGNDVEMGILPRDMGLVGGMVEDICFNNAKSYFTMEL